VPTRSMPPPSLPGEGRTPISGSERRRPDGLGRRPMLAQLDVDTLEEHGAPAWAVWADSVNGWHSTSHAYSRRALSHLSGGATKLLWYLLSYTAGYQRNTVTLTISEIMDGARRRDGTRLDPGAGLAKSTVQAAIAELRRLGLISYSITGRGRSRAFAFVMEPPIAWKLPPEAARENGPKISPLANGPKSSPKATQIGPKIDSRGLNRHARGVAAVPEIKRTPEGADARTPTIPETKHIDTKGDARATHARPASSSSKPTKEPNPRVLYAQELVAALRAELNGATLPSAPREYKAAYEWYWDAGRDGVPAPVAEVMACYRVVKTDPYWANRHLGLHSLEYRWSAWLSDGPAAVKANVAREQARAAARSGPQTVVTAPAHTSPAMIPVTAQNAGWWD
jgi:hypothetical protein